MNWLLRQIKAESVPDLHLRLHWPGASAPTQHLISDLRENVEIAREGKEHLTPSSFHLFEAKRLGGRFIQQGNFIEDLEKLIPAFYGTIGSRLFAWKKPAPRLKTDRSAPDDVSMEALSDEAESFEG